MKRLFILIFILIFFGCSGLVTKDNFHQKLEQYATKIYVQNKIDELQNKIEQRGYVTGEEVLNLIERSGQIGQLPDELLKLLEETGTNKIRAFITTHGGGTGALDAISCLNLATNDLGLVFRVSDATMLFYYYDSTGTDPEELTNYTIIEPDDVDSNCSGNGTWGLFDAFTFAGTSAPTLNFKDSDQAHQTVGRIQYNATDANDSTGIYQVEEGTTLTTYLTLDAVNELIQAARDINLATGKTLQINGTDVITEVIEILVFDDSQDVATGDGAGDVFFRIPAKLNGWYLSTVAAQVQTAGTTGNTDIMVYNVTQAQDFLSTAMRIETTETDTSTSAQPGTINDSNDQVSTADSIRIDVDAVQTTAPKGLIVELTFSPID